MYNLNHHNIILPNRLIILWKNDFFRKIDSNIFLSVLIILFSIVGQKSVRKGNHFIPFYLFFNKNIKQRNDYF